MWWRLDRALDLEMLEWSAKLGALEALESGCTAIVDHHESPNAIEGSLDVIAKACDEVGVRIEVLRRIMGTRSGTAGEITAWLQGYSDAGCEHICIRLASPDVDTQLDRLVELVPDLRPIGGTAR